MKSDDGDETTPEAAAAKPLRSRPLAADEQYFYEQSYKEPVESTARVEETAKFLVGATATTSGLFVAAFKLALGKDTAASILWLLPFAAWALAIVALILVLFPMRYRVGHNQPAALRDAYLRARDHKYGFLCAGALLFVVGILLALVPLGG